MNERFRQIQAILGGETTLVLATVDGNANPRSTPLFYLAGNDLRLYWFSARSSRHSRNCARIPRASVAIFRNARNWKQIRGVQMDGLVSVISDRVLRRRITHDYCIRFALEDHFRGIIRHSALYCFTPAWVRYLDNSRAFGFKFELKLGGKPGLV
jgi:uncharacterized protein